MSRHDLKMFRHGLKMFCRDLKMFRPGLKMSQRELKILRPDLETFRANLRMFRRDLNIFQAELKMFRRGLKMFRPDPHKRQDETSFNTRLLVRFRLIFWVSYAPTEALQTHPKSPENGRKAYPTRLRERAVKGAFEA